MTDFSPAAPVASRPPNFRKEGFVSSSVTILSFLLAHRPQKHERLSPGVWGVARQSYVPFIISEGRMHIYTHTRHGRVSDQVECKLCIAHTLRLGVTRTLEEARVTEILMFSLGFR